MHETLIPVRPEVAAKARMTAAQYKAEYAEAAADPAAFWGREQRRLDWMTPPTKILSGDFTGDVRVKWFEDGVLNVSANCLDRHLATRGDATAIIWEGDDPASATRITYRDLHERVCRLANALKGLGVAKGDRVCIYLPMVVEAAVAMLACARIGAIHTVVFGGFSPDSLANRLQDAGVGVLITADEGRRGGRRVPLKTNADTALAQCPSVKHVVVVKVTGGDVPMQAGRDHDYATLCAAASPDCPPEPMNAEDPLFILYTSGSTGKPKGALHTTGGYLMWVSYTFEKVFDYRPGEVFWCTADVGFLGADDARPRLGPRPGHRRWPRPDRPHPVCAVGGGPGRGARADAAVAGAVAVAHTLGADRSARLGGGGRRDRRTGRDHRAWRGAAATGPARDGQRPAGCRDVVGRSVAGRRASWDPAQSARVARLQLVDVRGRAYLVAGEMHRERPPHWRLEGIYD